MLKSEEINELAAALARAQGSMKPAVREAVNPYFKSRYADLASVVEAIQGPFSENGLAYVQAPMPVDGDRVCVETMLMHSSGQWVVGVVELPVTKADSQGYGSAITYARRYGLQSIAGIAAEDDDGNAAASAKPTKDRMGNPKQKEPAPQPGIVSTEQAEEEGNRNFASIVDIQGALPDVDSDTQRNLLLGQIKGVNDKLKLSDEKKREMWSTHVGKAKPENADPAALSDLLKALRSLSRAQ